MRVPSTIPFGEWLPDLPANGNPGSIVAKNVIPSINSFAGLRSLLPFTNALAGACKGLFWMNDKNGNIVNMAGDPLTLYKLDSNGSSWVDVSKAGGYTAGGYWEFAKFGERVIATNGGDPVQKFDVGTDTAFSDLAGSPPVAKHIAIVRDFVMLGDIDGKGPNFVQWSGYNNSELWTPDIATQSDQQQLFGNGGAVQRIVPGRWATVLLEQSIYIGRYTGPPTIFQFDEIAVKRGTPSPRSVVWAGSTIWFFGWDGFYRLDAGSGEPVSISHNRISRWFADNSDPTAWEDMVGTVDIPRRLLIWAFKSSASATNNDRLLIYNWVADKWATAEVETQFIGEYVPPGVTLDNLDTFLVNGIDTDSILVDSSAYSGGGLNTMAFAADNTGGTFDGAYLTAELESSEVSDTGMQRLFLSAVRPLIEGNGSTATTVSVGTRNSLEDTPVYTNPKAPHSASRQVPFRKNARFMRFRVQVTGGFAYADGVKITVNPAGGER